MSLVREIKSDIYNEIDYKGRKSKEKYIKICLNFEKCERIIISNQKLVDNQGKELAKYKYPFTSSASALCSGVTFEYKVPFKNCYELENYYLKENSVFEWTYRFSNTQKNITERYIFKNDIWEREQ